MLLILGVFVLPVCAMILLIMGLLSAPSWAMYLILATLVGQFAGFCQKLGDR